MNPFSYYITELFEQPFPVREYKRLGYGPATAEITYLAQDEQGRDLVIDITNVGGGWEINFTIDGSHDLTHSGKPFRVLATVVKAVEVFLKWHKDEFDRYPASFDMISKRSESKRDVVYSALMQRFGKKYGYKIADTFVTNRNARPEDQRTVTTARLQESANPSTAQPKPEYFQKPFSISGKIVQLYPVWDVPVKSKSYHNKIGRAALRAWERTGRAVRPNEVSPEQQRVVDANSVWRWRVRVQTDEGWMLMGFIGSTKRKEDLPPIRMGDTVELTGLQLSARTGGTRYVGRTFGGRATDAVSETALDYRSHRYDRQLHGKVKRVKTV